MATNDPMPWQLTIGALRQSIGQVPDEVVVCLALPPSAPRSDEFTLFLNLETTYAKGAVFQFRPSDADRDHKEALAETPVRIASAGNVVVPAIRVLEQRGFSVSRELEQDRELWRARRGSLEAVGADPLELLGLVTIVEGRGAAWRTDDAELADVMQRFGLEAP